MRVLNALDRGAGTGQKRCVIQGMRGQKRFQIAGRAPVKVNARLINKEPHRRLSGAAWVKRAQKGILDAQKRDVIARSHGFTSWRNGALPPYAHQIPFAGAP